MLRQAIITSKTANAIAVANTVIIVANERTYITPYANVRNTLFPWTEKAPAIAGRGKLKQSGSKVEFGPIRSARHWAEHLLSGVVAETGTCSSLPKSCLMKPRQAPQTLGPKAHLLREDE
jgi:hypothetical protein